MAFYAEMFDNMIEKATAQKGNQQRRSRADGD